MVPDKKKLRFRGAGSAAASAGFSEWPGAPGHTLDLDGLVFRRLSFTKEKKNNSSTTCVYEQHG